VDHVPRAVHPLESPGGRLVEEHQRTLTATSGAAVGMRDPARLERAPKRAPAAMKRTRRNRRSAFMIDPPGAPNERTE
jgi:hypothetical protein